MNIYEAFEAGSSISANSLAILITGLIIGSLSIWVLINLFKHSPQNESRVPLGWTFASITGLFILAITFIVNFWR